MNVVDGLVIGIVAFCFLFGFLKGFLRKVLGIVSILLAGLAAFICSKKGASVFQATMVFTATNIALNIVFWVLGKMFRKPGNNPVLVSRMGGGAIGACEGVVYSLGVLLLLYLTGGLLSVSNPSLRRTLDESVAYGHFITLSKSSQARGVREAHRMIETLRGPQSAITVDPKVMEDLKNDPMIKAIYEDKELVESIRKKEYGKVMTNPKIMRALQDKELVRKLTAKGVIRMTDVPGDVREE